ncbi:MAG: hypothetical protein ACE5KZ_07435 [Candidatus Scalinduaceae bacterium]
MHKQDDTRNKDAKFTKEELLSIFEEEAKHICKKPDEAHSIAESALCDFLRMHGEYVRLV